MIEELRHGFYGRTIKSSLLLYLVSIILMGVVAIILRGFWPYKMIVVLTPLIALAIVTLELGALMLRHRQVPKTHPASILPFFSEASKRDFLLVLVAGTLVLEVSATFLLVRHLPFVSFSRFQKRDSVERVARIILLLTLILLFVITTIVVYCSIIFSGQGLIFRVGLGFGGIALLIFVYCLGVPALAGCGKKSFRLSEGERNWDG